MTSLLLHRLATESLAALALAIIPWSLPGPSYESDIIVTTVADGKTAGELIRFSLADGLSFRPDRADTPLRVATQDLVQIATNQPSVAPASDAIRFELTNGDLLYGKIHGFQDGAVMIDASNLGEMEILTDRLTCLKTPAASRQEFLEAIAIRETGTALVEDTILLTNRDVIQGFISAIESAFLSIDTPVGVTQIPIETVVAAWLVSAKPPPIDGAYAIITALDGQRLTATQIAWDANGVNVTLPHGAIYKFPAGRISQVSLAGGRWEWLASLEPISYEHTPALSISWDFKPDRSVTGTPMRTAGRQFTHGIGLHSESAITFDLKGNYREFVTSMGLDDSAGPFADVDVEIRVDGHIQFEQAGIVRGALHGPIRLNVTGAKNIKLSVLFGKNADLQDRFNWIEPALIK